MKGAMAAKKTQRGYKDQTLKLLWGRAAGRCSAPWCRVNLIAEETDYDPAVPIGEIAHVEAAADGGPRANSALSREQRDSYENLILLCAHCHARFDRQEKSHSVEAIRRLKQDHEAWVKASLPERGRSRRGWRAILLRGDHPVDPATFEEALSPDHIDGGVFELSVAGIGNSWSDVPAMLSGGLESALAVSDLFESRFAVFPLAAVSACLYLGYLLTNRPTIKLFQFHRDERTWVWPGSPTEREGLSVTTVHGCEEPSDVAFLFELSATIDRERVRSILPARTQIVSLSVPTPRTSWLQSPRHLVELARTAREIFEDVLANSPEAGRWHVFYAGPAPGAVAVGQQLNPTMTPPVQLYEFRYPNHIPSVLIGGSQPRNDNQ
jgi:hypothetical protein